MQYNIKKKAWEVIYHHLTQEKGLHTRDEFRLRLFYEAIWYIARTGCQWRFIPPYYGNWRTIHSRFFSLVTNGRMGPFV